MLGLPVKLVHKTRVVVLPASCENSGKICLIARFEATNYLTEGVSYKCHDVYATRRTVLITDQINIKYSYPHTHHHHLTASDALIYITPLSDCLTADTSNAVISCTFVFLFVA